MKLAGVCAAGNLGAVLVEGQFPVWALYRHVQCISKQKPTCRYKSGEIPRSPFLLANFRVPTIWVPGQSRKMESILCPKCSKDQCHDKECGYGRSGDKQYWRWLI